MNSLYQCTACKRQTMEPAIKGNGWIELILWLCYIIPGLIYSIWRRSGSKVCPTCKKDALIPVLTFLDDEDEEQSKVSTRECPYCFETVQSRAVLCKHCGSDLEPVIDVPLPVLKQAKKTKKFKRVASTFPKKPASKKTEDRNVSGSDVLLIVFIIFLIYAYNNRTPDKTPSKIRANTSISTPYKASDSLAVNALFTPYTACSFLSVHGLKTKQGYVKYADDMYSCSSPYKEFGRALPQRLKNNIAYYVSGNSSSVETIKLVINVNNPNETEQAHAMLSRYASLLEKEAFSRTIGPQRLKAIASADSQAWNLKGVGFEVKKINWSTGKGYEVQYIIKL